MGKFSFKSSVLVGWGWALREQPGGMLRKRERGSEKSHATSGLHITAGVPPRRKAAQAGSTPPEP